MPNDTTSRFERARIVGARATQISMGAPLLVLPDDPLDPVGAAQAEHDAGVCPITIHRPASGGPR